MAKMSDSKKRTEELVRRLRAQGITVEKGKGHWKAYTPGDIVVFSTTPTDHASVINAVSRLRRNGVDPYARKEKQPMAATGSYVRPTKEDLATIRKTLDELGYVPGKKGKGGVLARVGRHINEVAGSTEGLEPFPSEGAAAQAIRHILQGGRSTFDSYSAIMAGIRDIYSPFLNGNGAEHTEPEPDREPEAVDQPVEEEVKVGPLYGDGKKFVCDFPGCGKEFELASSLGAHKNNAHGIRGESAESRRRRAQKEQMQDSWATGKPIKSNEPPLHMRVLAAMLSDRDPDYAMRLAMEVAELEDRASH